jgi:hypothetical protein
MLDFDKVKGLKAALEDPAKSKVSTIYSYDTADKTWDLIREFKGDGEAIFTQPFGVIKCAGGESDLSDTSRDLCL